MVVVMKMIVMKMVMSLMIGHDGDDDYSDDDDIEGDEDSNASSRREPASCSFLMCVIVLQSRRVFFPVLFFNSN